MLTSSNDIVNDKDLLAGLDSALLHLEEIGAVLLLVSGSDAGTGHLALLADGNEGGAHSQGERGAEEEATGIKTDNDIGLDMGELDLELESVEESLVGVDVLEEGEDIDKVDAGDGEVGEGLQGGHQLYLCTGEFGGGGGGGGGLASRGILVDVGLHVGVLVLGEGNKVCHLGGRFGVGAHDEREKRGKGGKKVLDGSRLSMWDIKEGWLESNLVMLVSDKNFS